MKSEGTKRKVGRVAMFGGAVGLGLLFSLGIVGRHAASSKTQVAVAIEPARASEALDATAQPATDTPEQHLKGHSEIELQCD